jgi:hypothetical protein
LCIPINIFAPLINGVSYFLVLSIFEVVAEIPVRDFLGNRAFRRSISQLDVAAQRYENDAKIARAQRIFQEKK